jgi:TolB-like protein/DNA-binding winged helix-turn-helix (wHTH) protein
MSYWGDFKRRHAKSGQRSGYAFSGFVIDDRRRILFRTGGERIPLPPKVFDTLLYFVERSGQLLDKRELLEAIWPDVVVDENNLNQAISALRRVLGETPGQHRFIVTEPGRGYRFVPDVQNVSEAFRADVAAKESMKRVYVAVAIAAVLVLATAVWYGLREVEPPLRHSIAVLPFENQSTGPEKAYWAEGIYEEILNQLAKIERLRVIPSISVRRYANSTLSAPEIADELKVGTIMEGSVRFADQQLRVTVTLIDARSDEGFWSNTYTSALDDDAFALESGIAVHVAEELNIHLSPVEADRFRQVPTNSWQALDLYLQLRTHRDMDVEQRIELLGQALEIDPDYWLAYVTRANFRTGKLLNTVNAGASSLATWRESERLIFDDVERALNIKGDVALPYMVRGKLHQYAWRWDEARRDFDRAAELDPNFSTVFSSFRGAHSQAISAAERLRDLAPDRVVPWRELGLAYAYAGQPDKAKEALQKANMIRGDNLTALFLGFMDARLGNNRAAAAQFESIENDLARTEEVNLAVLPPVAVGYALIDLDDKAAELGQRILDADSADVDIGARAMAYLARGESERLAASLERVVKKIRRQEPDAGFFNLMMIKHNVMDHPILDEPSFRELREQLTGSIDEFRVRSPALTGLVISIMVLTYLASVFFFSYQRRLRQRQPSDT